jgi:predicted RNase H-like HicB family nuclease/predicted RNA binding protein YcfA (HicA-like mRNA interferase family)
MTRTAKLYAWILANPTASVPFRDFERLLRVFGFRLVRTTGSHRQFGHPAVAQVLSIQPQGKDATSYQIAQLIHRYRCRLRPDIGRVMLPHYHVNIFWHEPDDCWVADAPDLKSCSVFGQTPVEAVAGVQIAIDGWLAAAHELGIAIPEPSYTRDPFAAKAA